MTRPHPNVVFVFADEWRGQATGYAGDPNVRTPHIDALSTESVHFATAVAGCPVCCPWRASLITGQYPHTHRIILNDLCLSNDAVSMAQAFRRAGYQTAYIGKWHLDGHGRSSFIPRERRQGFEFWKALECTHHYNNSFYYADENVRLKWEGYDAIAQTREAQRYIRDHAGGQPFLLVLSWGPPHDPYQTAPETYRAHYRPENLILRANVPDHVAARARRDLAGYYAHCEALDACVGELIHTLKACGIEEQTVFVFTSDHGDMVGSQGEWFKQRPWDESILAPFLLRYPAELGRAPRTIHMPINAPDILPTLLGLSHVPVPETVEGTDYSGFLRGEKRLDVDAALIACYGPFGQWTRQQGGREYRGLRTERYTYVRDLHGPWLLYDNHSDPYQITNLCNDPQSIRLRDSLDGQLQRRLAELHDEFLPAEEYARRWNYPVDGTGTVPYTD